MLSKSEEKLLHALKSRSGREKNAAFVIEGVRVVEEALQAGVVLKFAMHSPSLEDSDRGRDLVAALGAATAVRQMSESELRAVAETETPQGIVAVAQLPRATLADVTPGARALVLVLDAVQDPGNLGTLVRCADAFAATCVVALPGTVDFWNSKVVRASAGATFHLPLINTDDATLWNWLDQNGFVICGADMTGSELQKTPARAALVVGNEGSGLRAETRAHIQQMLAIPMPGRAESLNVSVAAGILLYELSKNQK